MQICSAIWNEGKEANKKERHPARKLTTHLLRVGCLMEKRRVLRSLYFLKIIIRVVVTMKSSGAFPGPVMPTWLLTRNTAVMKITEVVAILVHALQQGSWQLVRL